nr:unnamed protein product [Callosobruchus chinensis]
MDMVGRRIQKLQHALLENWDVIPQEDIRHLILGMRRQHSLLKIPLPSFASNVFHFSIISDHFGSIVTKEFFSNKWFINN